MVDVVLHQWEISPYCRKVRKILRLKGVSYRAENYNGLRALKAARLTPAGKLPVLDIDGRRMSDSTVIAGFLNDMRPAPALYPSDTRDAALARMIEDWADESLFYYEVYFRTQYAPALSAAAALLCAGRPAWERLILIPILKKRMRAKLREHGFAGLSREHIEASFLRHLDDLEAILAAGDWLVGTALSIADIAVSSQIDEMVRTSHLASRIRGLPNVSRWLDRLAD